jgi:hypothetical protein
LPAVSLSGLSLVEWLGFSSAQARGFAEDVARRLGVELLGVEARRYGPDAVAMKVARFRLDGATYCLVPGGEAQLGFDVERWSPSAAELASCSEDTEPDRFPLRGQLDIFGGEATENMAHPDQRDVCAYVARRVSPPRTAVLPALLVAAEAIEVGGAPVGLDDPLVRELVTVRPGSSGPLGFATFVGPCDGVESVRIGFNAAGRWNVRARREHASRRPEQSHRLDVPGLRGDLRCLDRTREPAVARSRSTVEDGPGTSGSPASPARSRSAPGQRPGTLAGAVAGAARRAPGRVWRGFRPRKLPVVCRVVALWSPGRVIHSLADMVMRDPSGVSCGFRRLRSAHVMVVWFSSG